MAKWIRCNGKISFGSTAAIEVKDNQTQFGISRGGVPHGVAPQCEVGNIGFGRRAFIPATYGNGAPIPKGYLDSHSIGNYGWIFDIKPDQGDASKGYVTPK